MSKTAFPSSTISAKSENGDGTPSGFVVEMSATDLSSAQSMPNTSFTVPA